MTAKPAAKFSDVEAVKIATGLEKDGLAFYRAAARAAKRPGKGGEGLIVERDGPGAAQAFAHLGLHGLQRVVPVAGAGDGTAAEVQRPPLLVEDDLVAEDERGSGLGRQVHEWRGHCSSPQLSSTSCPVHVCPPGLSMFFKRKSSGSSPTLISAFQPA